MNVLLTNDDGIRARGLRALYAALREAGHTVYVVAPMTQQSGVGHSLTVFEPVRAMLIEEPGFTGTGVFGTPTDCVKLALGRLLHIRLLAVLWLPVIISGALNLTRQPLQKPFNRKSPPTARMKKRAQPFHTFLFSSSMTLGSS